MIDIASALRQQALALRHMRPDIGQVARILDSLAAALDDERALFVAPSSP